MKILVVEDEPRMLQLLVRGLTEEGHAVDGAERAARARELARHCDYDVVVLDWGLPDRDGIALLDAWRAEGSTVPVLLLTARGSSGEKVLALRRGADDYLVKPFDFEELVARLEALHRRSAGAALRAPFGDVTLDRARRELRGPAGVVQLTSREFQLLGAFAERPGDVRTRSELLSTVWGHAGEGNVVDVYVGYLRAKLEEVGARRVAIATVRGMGYRLAVTPEARG